MIILTEITLLKQKDKGEKMNNFEMINFIVKNAMFSINENLKNQNEYEAKIQAKFLRPKNNESKFRGNVTIDFEFGDNNTDIDLKLKVVATFKLKNEEVEIKNDLFEKECLPIALKKLRKTIANVTTAYGLPPLDLPIDETININD